MIKQCKLLYALNMVEKQLLLALAVGVFKINMTVAKARHAICTNCREEGAAFLKLICASDCNSLSPMNS